MLGRYGRQHRGSRRALTPSNVASFDVDNVVDNLVRLGSPTTGDVLTPDVIDATIEALIIVHLYVQVTLIRSLSVVCTDVDRCLPIQRRRVTPHHITHTVHACAGMTRSR